MIYFFLPQFSELTLKNPNNHLFFGIAFVFWLYIAGVIKLSRKAAGKKQIECHIWSALILSLVLQTALIPIFFEILC